MTGQPRIRLSRNETEALCQKAARGAGLTWGMAEEAGFAAGWLAAHGIDGASVLLEHLTRRTEIAGSARHPDLVRAHWQATGGLDLCPIALGAALSDHAHMMIGQGDHPITTDAVHCPVLLVPFLDAIAMRNNLSLLLLWTDDQMQIGGDVSALRAAAAVLAPIKAVPVSILCFAATRAEPFPLQTPPLVPAGTIAALNAFAFCTTVPATATSRHGAGAVLSDND